MTPRRDLQLADGRRIRVAVIHIDDAAADAGIVYAASTETVWNCVVGRLGQGLPGHLGDLPMFVVPPVSVRRDELVVPRWKVYALLDSDALGPVGPLGEARTCYWCSSAMTSPADRSPSSSSGNWRRWMNRRGRRTRRTGSRETAQKVQTHPDFSDAWSNSIPITSATLTMSTSQTSSARPRRCATAAIMQSTIPRGVTPALWHRR